MAKSKREFRSQESYDSERISRDLVGPFLRTCAIAILGEQRVKAGRGESQVIDARLPDGRVVRMRVRLCWRRDPGHVASRRYSALQLRAQTIDGDWEKTLREVADRDAREGISHTLAFQRDGEAVPFAALVPSPALPAIWDAQRATSARLAASGELGRMRGNHATNGNSPTLWLQDDRHEAAVQVADVLWDWPGVVTLAREASPVPTKLAGSTTQRLLAGSAPTAEEYAVAIRAANLSDKEMRWLSAHANAPGATASMEELAEALGYEVFRNANALYGAVAHKVAARIDRRARNPGNWMHWLAGVVERNVLGHSQWRLRDEVQVALRQLSVAGREAWDGGGGVHFHARASRSIAAYVARLAFNSQGWRRPASAAEVSEAGETYRNEHGFGHEDWLFRNEWQIDGWRYGFVQGVNKSRKKLLAAGEPFDLRLFTMPGPGDRRAVAEIREVECLTDELAADAVSVHEQFGWLDTMRREVAEAGGRPDALDATAYAPFIFNLRYRWENLRMLDDSAPLPPDDPIQNIKRYSLCRVDGAMDRARKPWRGRAGTNELPASEHVYRRMSGGLVVCSPEHRRMQAELLEILRKRYPDAEAIVLEEDFVDAIVRTADETLIFEVKSDLNPLAVLRQAMGQLLEYAYHPRRSHRPTVRLVVVGRRPLSGDDAAYFESIRTRFGLPIDYWVVPI